MGVTDLDRFWVHAQIDLLSLPRPWAVLEQLDHIDTDLHSTLVKGEQWLLLPERTLDELERGWGWWLRLFREAIGIVNAYDEQIAL